MVRVMEMQRQIVIKGSQEPNEKGKETHNTEIPGCIRCLWNGERIFLWGPNYNEAVTARIVGDVSEKDLKRALDAVRRIHPLLGAKVIFDTQHDAWFTTDNVPETIFRTVQRTSDTQWFDEIQKEHMIPFEVETGPLIRFVLVHSPQVSELIVFAQHSICDGIALANLIRDILTFYAEPAKGIKAIEPSLSTDYLQLNESPSSSSKSIGNDTIHNLNLQWRQRPHYFSQVDFIEVHKAYWKKMQYNMTLLQLEPYETSILGAKCRKNGITINSAMTAAFLAAYQEVIGSFPIDHNMIGIPYDLRRRLPENASNAAFCFFIGGTGFPYLYEQKKDLWENAQEIHKMIHKGMEQLDIWGRELLPFDPALLDAKIFDSFMQLVPEASEETKNLKAFAHDAENIAFTFTASKVRVAILNTNLGRLDYPETYGNLRLDRMFFTPSGADVPLLLGGIGFNGKLAFTLNYVKDMEGDDGSSLDQDMIQIRNSALKLLGFPEKANNRAVSVNTIG